MKPITIVGGGLAGLVLGIGLRRRGVPVRVIEAGHYPRHRVCGEFMSGRGPALLAEMDLEEKIMAAGVCEAGTATFFSPSVNGIARPLPQPALCVSRYILDDLLAREFQRLGGTLCQQQRWRDGFGDGVVRATGRRQAEGANKWRWFGLKAHARGVRLGADLELHVAPQGYVGLCRLIGGVVNVCGLFRSREVVPGLGRTWREWLSGPARSALRERMASAELLPETFCSVAGLQPIPERIVDRSECRVGDAITMIPPFTGNGMSMAIESGVAATAPVASYSAGSWSWAETCEETARGCERRFSKRLWWSACLQRALFHPKIADPMIWLGSRCGGIWQTFFRQTR